MSNLAPFCKIKIPTKGGKTEDSSNEIYRKIKTSSILTVDGSPSLEMLTNVVTIILQEQQRSIILAGLQYWDEEGDLVDLMSDDDLEEALQSFGNKKLKIKIVEKETKGQIQLSLYGRNHASILIDYHQILQPHNTTSRSSSSSSSSSMTTTASYWKLLQVATELFRIPSDYPVMMFRVSSANGQIKTEIANDVDLSSHLERVAHTGWVEPVHVEIVGSYLTIANHDGTNPNENVPLTQFLSPNGKLSFSKLIKYSRQKDPHKPLKSYMYLDDDESNGDDDPATNNPPPKTSDIKPARTLKKLIGNNDDLIQAFNTHAKKSIQTNPLVIHPNYQSPDLALSPEDAIVCGTCELGNDPLRPVLLNAADSMASWDVSNLVPGRYKAKASYFRTKTHGPASLYTGKVVMAKEHESTNCTSEYRSQLSQLRLEGTGDSVTVGGDYEYVALGELEIMGTPGEKFLVASQPPASWFGSDACLAVRDLSLIYLGL